MISFQNDQLTPILAGGDFADLYWEDVQTQSIRWEDGRVEKVVAGHEAGAGLRYWVGPENRFAYSDVVTLPALDALSRRLLAGAAPKNKIVWNQSRRVAPPMKRPFDAIAMDDKIALLQKIFQACQIPHVKQVSIQYGQSVKHMRIWNSLGEDVEEIRPMVTLSLTVIAEKNGVLQSAHEAMSGSGGWELFDRRSPVTLARSVAERAVKRLDAPPAPLGQMPVVIAGEAGGTLIHEAIGHPLEADAVQKGVSPVYLGAVGKKVGHEKITVYEDPTMSGQRGFYGFDDEGVPAQRVALVENGILKTYLYDRRTAVKDKVAPNGHGRRESFRHMPIPRMANTFVGPGPDDPKKILASVPNGLFVTRMGGGQVEPATGDFVFEVEEGFLIQDGQVKHLIRGANLLGNGPDALQKMDMVASDMGWSVGTCGKDGQGAPVSDGLPTLRIPSGVVVGGVSA